jgi:hypothetical protein
VYVIDVIERTWYPALLGGGLTLVGAATGWAMAGQPRLPPVRIVAWWVSRVVRPLLFCGSWWRRTAAIFANNAGILAALVCLGRWHLCGLAATALIGVTLGMGLRVLSRLPGDLAAPWPTGDRDTQRRVRWGILLNLLEPPAIVLAIGLSLSQDGARPLPSGDAWAAFGLIVAPMTLAAAGGEALWLGASRRWTHRVAAADSPPRDDVRDE